MARSLPVPVGAAAVQRKGALLARKWLLLRRLSQTTILALFLAGPLGGLWLVKGSLSSSLTLDVLPLSDPFVLLQGLAAGHVPQMSGILGAGIVIVAYLVLGGRSYCSWVCPVNPITDAAAWLQQRLGLRPGTRLSRHTRYLLLALALGLPVLSGSLVWELANPVSILYRGLVFGMGAAWSVAAAVFLFDLLVSRRGWCAHLCPMGAFYSLLGAASVVRVNADGRARCNDCLDCFAVCPEPQVIKPALKGEAHGVGPVILSSQCTNCGRCIDVCAEDVFGFATRFHHPPTNRITQETEVTP